MIACNQTELAKHSSVAVFIGENQEQSNRQTIVARIQSMIQHLQCEHDLIFRLLQNQLHTEKLQRYRSSSDDKVQGKVATLNEHLVRIASNIHDLHQLNMEYLRNQ